MIELGYMAKRIIARPDWLHAPVVSDIYAVCDCMSADFCDFINHWEHNGFWFFDSPRKIERIAAKTKMNLSDTTLLYFRGYPKQYDADLKSWIPYGPDSRLATNVSPPANATILGYDVVTYSTGCAPEHSPLSCNHVASGVRINVHCLLDSLEHAIKCLDKGTFDNTEPGPFRIIAVYLVDSQNGGWH